MEMTKVRRETRQVKKKELMLRHKREETPDVEKCNVTKEIEGRASHTPAWMQDYADGEGLSKDEAYVAQVTTKYLFYFEEDVKKEKWVQTMNSKITSIEKNKTLIELPTEAKMIGVK